MTPSIKDALRKTNNMLFTDILKHTLNTATFIEQNVTE